MYTSQYQMLSLPSTELNVTITADYTPAPDEAPGELADNEFTAGSGLTLKCMAQGGSGTLSYSWSVTDNPSTPTCPTCTPPTVTTPTFGRSPLYSFFAGTYTCTVNGVTSNGFTVRVVGEFMIICVIHVCTYTCTVCMYNIGV